MNIEDKILITTHNRIATVTLNNPQSKNAMSLEMWHRLATIFNELSSNTNIQVILLTGSGGNFCSGADISEFSQVRGNSEQVHAYEQAVDVASESILHCKKPVIGVIEGYCIGGGLGLAMACDFRIAAFDSCFFIPASRMSIVYGLRETQTLLSLVGLTQAKRILFLGERIYADTAKEIGLIDQSVPKAKLSEKVTNFTRLFDHAAPLTISGSKKILNQLAFETTEATAKQLLAIIQSAGDSEDYQEGRLAFIEKRSPNFKGK